jgi:photosystem II stability/assembly factor-like uncharacterized protein
MRRFLARATRIGDAAAGMPRPGDERRAHGFHVAVGALLLVPSLSSGCVITLKPLHTDPSEGGADGGDEGSGDEGGGDAGSGDVDGSNAGGTIITGSPPAGSWVNVTANLAGMASQCGNMSSVFVKPDENLVIAGIAADGLWGSHDDGMSWQALGMGPASATITNRPLSLVYDPVTPKQYWESGSYNGGGVYETMDDGFTFTQLGDVMDCDTVSVDLTDPKRQTLLAGAHENPQTLYRSTDGGMTWINVGVGLPPDIFCTFPIVINPLTYLAGCGGVNGGKASGIYRTVDGGVTWTQVSGSGGGSAPLMTANGNIYWASPNDSGMTMSMNGGLNWQDVVSVPYTIVNVHPVELPGGTIATLGNQYVVTSSDGVTWKIASPLLPFGTDPHATVGIVYSSHENAFYVWSQTCDFASGATSADAAINAVPADAIMKYVIGGGTDD